MIKVQKIRNWQVTKTETQLKWTNLLSYFALACAAYGIYELQNNMLYTPTVLLFYLFTISGCNSALTDRAP